MRQCDTIWNTLIKLIFLISQASGLWHVFCVSEFYLKLAFKKKTFHNFPFWPNMPKTGFHIFSRTTHQIFLILCMKPSPGISNIYGFSFFLKNDFVRKRSTFHPYYPSPHTSNNLEMLKIKVFPFFSLFERKLKISYF